VAVDSVYLSVHASKNRRLFNSLHVGLYAFSHDKSKKIETRVTKFGQHDELRQPGVVTTTTTSTTKVLIIATLH